MTIKSIKKFFKNFTKEEIKTNSKISISNQPTQPKIVLLIFPIDKDFFRVASYTYRNLPYNKNQTIFHYVIDDNFSDSFSLRKGEIHKIELDKKNNIINKNILLNTLKDINFDIIIDLNINFKIEIAKIVNELESKYKIGFVSKYSDYFYNVQLKANNNNIYEPIKDIIG